MSVEHVVSVMSATSGGNVVLVMSAAIEFVPDVEFERKRREGLV
jgi:hypothetical protein